MYSKTITVCNPTGLHARPAARFVTEAKRYTSEIMIQGPGPEKVDAKSMALVLSLGLNMGTEVTLTASGEDEKEAVEKLAALIESGLDE